MGGKKIKEDILMQIAEVLFEFWVTPWAEMRVVLLGIWSEKIQFFKEEVQE